MRDLAGFNDPLPGSQMPPNIWIDGRTGRYCQHSERQNRSKCKMLAEKRLTASFHIGNAKRDEL